MVAVDKDIGGSVADTLDDWRSKDCVEESTVARRLVKNLDGKVLDEHFVCVKFFLPLSFRFLQTGEHPRQPECQGKTERRTLGVNTLGQYFED